MFVKNGAWSMWKCTKFPNCMTFLDFPEEILCIKKKTSKLVAKILPNKSDIVPDYTMFNLGIWSVCWARFMCHHELWAISVSHPFSFLNSSLGLAGAKHYQKITIPILRVFAVPGWFPYILRFPHYYCLLYSGWVVIVVCGSISVQG